MMEVLIFAFFAGQAAAFNPCGAAMFPAYVGYQLGTAETSRSPAKSAASAVLMGLSATAGFVVVFGAVGLVLAAGGALVGKLLPFVGLGVGVLIAATGVWLLVTGRKIGIMAASRVNLGQGRGLRNVFLFGIAYAIASLSCALPLFLVAVGIIAGQTLSAGSVVEVITGAVIYGLGMGVVMVGATVGIVFFKEAVSRWIRVLMMYVEPAGKLAMVGAGAYLIYYWSLGSGSELLALRAEQLF
jgi:cytochrome c biogenesis protein CcdA